jgi:Na+/H+ antiporter NhaD/arsenite permease-like protein
VAAVDFNTLGLLLGMMLIVNITRRSGLFQYVAIWAAKKVDARPWGILLMMSIVTAVFSAFLDNVTTVLLTVPVMLLITDELKVKPYPYLFAQIFASNIGGTATLIGDPDRRPAEHHDRLGHRPHVQRLRHCADVDHHPDLRGDDDPADQGHGADLRR